MAVSSSSIVRDSSRDSLRSSTPSFVQSSQIWQAMEKKSSTHSLSRDSSREGGLSHSTSSYSLNSSTNPSIASISPTLTPSTSDLIVPLTFWSGPPSHSISCVLVSPSKEKIVTGSRTGNLILWNLHQYSQEIHSPRDWSSSEDMNSEEVPVEQVFEI